MEHKVYLLNTETTRDDLETSHPYPLCARSEAILPADCPIMSNLFVVDKMDVVVSDGENGWYRTAPGTKEVKSATAGQAISDLF